MHDAPSTSAPTLTREAFVAGARYPLTVGGVRWYPRLQSDKTPEGRVTVGAMSDRDFHAAATVLSWELVGEGLPKRVFGVFSTALDAFDFVQAVLPRDRCLFEVCLGARKLFFDVDVSGETAVALERFFQTSAADVAERIVRALVEGVVEVAAAQEHALAVDPQRDFRLYESHGPAKRSYHLVLNRGDSAAVCKGWYDAVLASKAFEAFACFPAIRTVVDSSVYSVSQQLRLLGCQKSGSGRFKALRPTVPTARGDLFLAVDGTRAPPIVFCESLASGRAATLPALRTAARAPRRRDQGPALATTVLERALSLADQHGEFDLDRADGQVVYLRRRAPSLCPTCRVQHDHENPFLLLRPQEGGFDVRFDCRRSEAYGKKGSTSIGFVSAEKTIPANQPDGEFDPDFIGSFFSGGVEQRFYREAAPEPPVDEAPPPAAPDLPPADIRSWLDRVLVPCPGSAVPKPVLVEEAQRYFPGTPAQRGFRTAGRDGGIPTITELIEADGRRVVKKKKHQGAVKDCVVDFRYEPVADAPIAVPASAWGPPAFNVQRPFPLEPASLRDVTDAEDVFSSGQCVVLRGALGTGKTELLTEALAKADRSVLVSNRILLLRENRDAIIAKGGEVMFYSDCPGGPGAPISPPASFHGTLICCANSLHRILFSATSWRPSLIVVDECESVFAALTQHTVKSELQRLDAVRDADEASSFVTSYSIFASLLASTPRGVLADAAADQATLDYLRRYRPEARALHLDREPPARALDLYETQPLLLKKLLETLASESAEGRGVYCATNSRGLAKHVASLAREAGFKVCVITADGFDSDLGAQAFKQACGMDHDLVISSPKIGPGSSYAPPDGTRRYRKTFGFFTPASAPAIDAVQALLRVREVSELHVCVNAASGRSPLPDTAKTTADALRWLAESALGIRKLGSKIADPVTGVPSPYSLLVAKSLLARRLSNSKPEYEAELVRRLAENGITLAATHAGEKGERRTLEGVTAAADASTVASLVSVDLLHCPDPYECDGAATTDERLDAATSAWEGLRRYERAHAIAKLAAVPFGTPTLPIEVAERAVSEKWIRKRDVLFQLTAEKGLTDALPAGFSADVQEVVAFHYAQDISRQRAIAAMRAALPSPLDVNALVGVKVDPDRFGWLPEKTRAKAAERLFASAGIRVSDWVVTACMWRDDGVGVGIRVREK